MTLTGDKKLIAISAGAFIVSLSSIIAARSLYSNVKIGADKKTLLISSGIAIGTLFIMMKYLKK